MSLAYVHHWRPWLSIPAVLLTLVAVAFLIHELMRFRLEPFCVPGCKSCWVTV